MNIHPVRDELFQADGWVDGRIDKMMLTVTFHNFANVLQNYKNKQEGNRDRK
jgi:hypothetical protein